VTKSRKHGNPTRKRVVGLALNSGHFVAIGGKNGNISNFAFFLNCAKDSLAISVRKVEN
jgi:hypothetical protein